jgi:hypothetical protein
VVRIYDLVMTHKLDADDLFIHHMQEYCAQARLTFFMIEPLWVEEFHRRLQRGDVWARVLLNMHSEHHQPEEIFHRLVRLAAEHNVCVIDPPDRALAAFDKARLHARLISAGIQVPYSVIVPAKEVAGFQNSDQDRAALGAPFVIKPALGYGRRGLVMDAVSEKDLARSVAAWDGGDYLLQWRMVPQMIAGWPAYFRVYFVFGTVWCSWWNCYTDNYRLVTLEESESLKLRPLEEVIRRIAALTGMNFFSSEIALTETGEFVLIDYVNDQCHMLSQSANPQKGVPDELVAAVARRLVEAAREITARR